MTLPSAALATYEHLRSEVLAGHGRPAGLSAIVYHGLIRGLSLLSNGSAEAAAPIATAPLVPSIRIDPLFLHLVANMVLQTHQELTHVY